MPKKNNHYAAAIIFGVCWGWLIFTFILQQFNFQKILSPLTNSLFHNKKTYSPLSKYKLFSFEPGWAYNYIDQVDLNGIAAISHFDVPVNDDGTLMDDVTGYELLTSDKVLDLFQRARAQHIQALITFSQTDKPTIKRILDNPSAQFTFMQQALAKVDETGASGINLDFELHGEMSQYYRAKYTAFVKKLTDQVHRQIPGSIVTVTSYPQALNESVYDLPQIASFADEIFIEAYDFPVPELQDGKVTVPEYGGNARDYFKKVSTVLESFSEKIPSEKLVLERAWYGNGENYPIYKPDFNKSKYTFFASSNTLKTPLDQDTINQLIDGVPNGAKAAARNNVPIIAQALEKEGILNTNVLAYALATIEHETAGTFEPISEFKGPKSARRLGYEGGTDFYGRGFIQLTHLRNYLAMSHRLGLGDELVQNPNLVSRPEIAAAVLAVFFKENGVAEAASQGDFVRARTPINPDYMGWQIATLAFKYVI